MSMKKTMFYSNETAVAADHSNRTNGKSTRWLNYVRQERRSSTSLGRSGSLNRPCDDTWQTQDTRTWQLTASTPLRRSST